MATGVILSLMRDLESQYRITARSIPEIVGEMEGALSRYGMSRSVTFRGRKLSGEAFVNAAILHLLSLPPTEQERALGEAVSRLERMLSDEPGASSSPVVGHPVDPAPVRRRKSS